MNMKIIELDAQTGITTERDATAEEIAQLEIDRAWEAERKAEAEKKAKADEAAKQALLDRLGITAEEAALLLK